MTTKPVTEIEALLTKLEPLLPEGLYDEVNSLITELEEDFRSNENRVEELKADVSELEDQVSNLEDKVPDLYALETMSDHLSGSDKEKLALTLLEYSDRFIGEEGYLYIKFPEWMLPSNPFTQDRLEELINQHGVEEAIHLLSQPSHAA